MGTLERLPGITGRKVGMTSNHHAPYDLGYTRATMAVTERSESARTSVIAVMLGVILAGIIMGLASMGLFGGLSAIFAPK